MSVYLFDQRIPLTENLIGKLAFSSFLIPSSGYLIPSLIYTPVLPGTIEADHFARQLWWIATVESCVFGIAIIMFIKRQVIKLLGLFLIIIVVLIGAPPGEFHAHAPDDLVKLFFYYNIGIYSVCWIMHGAFLAYLFQKFQFQHSKEIFNAQ